MATVPAAQTGRERATEAREVLANPGLLKLELMRHGVRLDDRARAELHALPGQVGAFGNSADIDIILPQDTWVSVPNSAPAARWSPYLLVWRGDGFEVCWSPEDVAAEDLPPPVRVQLVPASTFYSKSTSTGIPLSRLGTVHGSYLALSPLSECAFVGSADQCRFCSLAPLGPSVTRVPIEDIVEAVRLAREDQSIDMVYLSVGYLDGPDAGLEAVLPYVRAIKKAFDILVAVDALPPREDTWIDRTYAAGVDSISYNLEIFDAARFERICPGPARHIGRQRFLDALEYAATVFPSGAVLCHLIVGLEPVDSTRAGIDALVERRVVPVLPMFRPFRGVDMRDHAEAHAPTLAELSELYGYLYRELRRKRVQMSWVRNISVVTTPAEGRFFAPGSGIPGLFQRLVGGPRKPSAMLSDWRRALRVQEVDDSLKSSGL
jgi:hypothetical protein